MRKDDKTSLNQDARAWGIGYLHPLSTRTNLYAAYGRYITRTAPDTRWRTTPKLNRRPGVQPGRAPHVLIPRAALRVLGLALFVVFLRGSSERRASG